MRWPCLLLLLPVLLDPNQVFADSPDPPEPPHGITYNARVIDASSGAPIAGVQIQATEFATLWRCSSLNSSNACQSCFTESWERHATATSTGAGAVSVYFTHLHCDQVSSDPPEWDSSLHDHWGTPELIDSHPTASAELLIDRIEVGPSPYDHTIYVIHEAILAERFAPVLHRHRTLERQEDLGDCSVTLEGSHLTGVAPDGRAVYPRSRVPPLHVWDPNLTWDSFGLRYGHHEYWGLDLPDDTHNLGAPAGSRPLYYHVFPFEDGVVVQYWLWFNANDCPDDHYEAFRVFHEGDWEHVAIYATRETEGWRPRRVNFHQHAGGNSVGAEACWWSPTTVATYEEIQQGYTADATHLHVWVAANSHATYNRDQSFYHIQVSGLFECKGNYSDDVDYNLASSTRGEHGFFPYDLLVPMGEVWSDEHAHGGGWSIHLEGNGPECLRFTGRFGEGTCALADSCPEACDNPFWEAYALAPLSPAMPEEPHNWLTFRMEDGRWGNPSGAFRNVEWIESPVRGSFLGAIRSCEDAPGDSIVFSVCGGGATDGIARVTCLSGDPQLSGLDQNQCQSLECGGDGRYTFRAAAASGEGELRIDIFREGSPEECVAEDLRLEVWRENCAMSDAPEEAPSISTGLLVSPNPGLRLICFTRLERPHAPASLSVIDVLGRRVWKRTLAPGEQTVEWRASPSSRFPAGVYTAILEVERAPTRSVRFTLLK